MAKANDIRILKKQNRANLPNVQFSSFRILSCTTIAYGHSLGAPGVFKLLITPPANEAYSKLSSRITDSF